MLILSDIQAELLLKPQGNIMKKLILIALSFSASKPPTSVGGYHQLGSARNTFNS
jgi:hypothetical protein